MQIIFRGTLKEKQAGAFQEWTQKNAQTWNDHSPEGWAYAGTYFTVFGFGRHDVESRWELSNYAALDAARDHDDEVWNKLAVESGDFFEATVTGETYLMRGVDDVKILE